MDCNQVCSFFSPRLNSHGSSKPSKGHSKTHCSCAPRLKGFAPHTHISETLLAPHWRWSLGGWGLLQSSDRETSFGCLPSSTAIWTCCQEVIPGDFISILQLASLGFAGPSGGAVQAACRQGAPRASRIPQRHARTAAACQDRQQQAEMLQEECSHQAF